jgi:hypothetical protein
MPKKKKPKTENKAVEPEAPELKADKAPNTAQAKGKAIIYTSSEGKVMHIAVPDPQ